ncbi:nuclear transport factor 2 family protein [Cupriavidus cauae]|uniref:Nuclear transport factor 2 family protein n=1 Tax=Cupriavidus cauae TaxID=2608999 RepID=A0A5M8ABR6_9BURK|nr:nuclear transport factor 2 family protein [Cupriavidus cauae]
MDDWNRRDVPAVLAAYADDALFVSALAQPYTGGTRVQGKDALRRYWLAALADRPDLRFELISAICDVEAQTVVVHYVAQAGGKRTRMCEIMRFENGRQVHGEALHGVPAEEGTP